MTFDAQFRAVADRDVWQFSISATELYFRFHKLLETTTLLRELDRNISDYISTEEPEDELADYAHSRTFILVSQSSTTEGSLPLRCRRYVLYQPEMKETELKVSFRSTPSFRTSSAPSCLKPAMTHDLTMTPEAKAFPDSMSASEPTTTTDHRSRSEDDARHRNGYLQGTRQDPHPH